MNGLDGDNYILLDCPICDFEDYVCYHKKPPVYCSPSCKQKAYRQRKKKLEKLTQDCGYIDFKVEFAQRHSETAITELEKVRKAHGGEAAIIAGKYLDTVLPLILKGF
jgi:hypothetical protein